MSEVISNAVPVCVVCEQSDRGIYTKTLQNPVQFTLENTLNTQKKNEPQNKRQYKTGWFSYRHYVIMMLFFGSANCFFVSTYISSTINAMVNQTAVNDPINPHVEECPSLFNNETRYETQNSLVTGKFMWDSFTQYCATYIFYISFVLFGMPASLLSHRYGSARLFGWGSLIGSALGLIIPIIIEVGGAPALCVVRVLQGIAMSPLLPCYIDLVSKWIPPNERNRCVAFVDSGGQFGAFMSYQFSGYISYTPLGWPFIFYFFGSVATLWSAFLIYTVYEDPDSNPNMDPAERKLINKLIRGSRGKSTSSSDCRKAFRLTWIPFFAIWIAMIITGWTADHYLSKGYTNTRIRKLAVALGSFGPGIFILLSSYSICLSGFNIAMLIISHSLTGIMSTSNTVNHLEIAPRYAGFLVTVSDTVSISIIIGSIYLWGGVVGSLQSYQGWMITFVFISAVYFATGIFFTIYGSGELQHWAEHKDKNHLTRDTTRTEIVF